MNLTFFIARRYLFSKNNRNAINFISIISVSVVAVATAALIIVLSSINGFGKLIESQISVYAPDLKISSFKGKTFTADSVYVDKIKKIEGVIDVVYVLEDNVLIKSEDRQIICTLKGISDNYLTNTGLDSMMRDGNFNIFDKKNNYAVLGIGIAIEAGISVEAQRSFSVWVLNRKYMSVANPLESFISLPFVPAGVVSVDNYIDAEFIYADIKVASLLLQREATDVSSLEVFTKPGADISKIKTAVNNLSVNKNNIETVEEQFEIYKVMKSERLASFLIILFIIIVASFSIVGSLTMLIIEKKEDILTLQSMGAKMSLIKKIFLTQGWFISIIGAIVGITVGGILSYFQQKFGFVTFPESGNYIIDAYPIDIKLTDFIVTFFSVAFIGFLIALYPLVNLSKRLSTID
jgi:lipoprotein-releasing system permease protein